MQPHRRRSLMAAACTVAVLALSGCAIPNLPSKAKDVAYYNAGANYMQTTDCFNHLKLKRPRFSAAPMRVAALG